MCFFVKRQTIFTRDPDVPDTTYQTTKRNLIISLPTPKLGEVDPSAAHGLRLDVYSSRCPPGSRGGFRTGRFPAAADDIFVTPYLGYGLARGFAIEFSKHPPCPRRIVYSFSVPPFPKTLLTLYKTGWHDIGRPSPVGVSPNNSPRLMASCRAHICSTMARHALTWPAPCNIVL